MCHTQYLDTSGSGSKLIIQPTQLLPGVWQLHQIEVTLSIILITNSSYGPINTKLWYKMCWSFQQKGFEGGWRASKEK